MFWSAHCFLKQVCLYLCVWVGLCRFVYNRYASAHPHLALWKCVYMCTCMCVLLFIWSNHWCASVFVHLLSRLIHDCPPEETDNKWFSGPINTVCRHISLNYTILRKHAPSAQGWMMADWEAVLFCCKTQWETYLLRANCGVPLSPRA